MATVNWSLQAYTDTAANLNARATPILEGQLAIETDTITTTPKFKIGDGVSLYSALPYFYGGALSAQNLSNVLSVGNTTGNNDIIQTGTSVFRNNDSSCFLDLATSGFLELYSTDGSYKYHVDSDIAAQYIEMKTEDIATQTELSYFQSIPLQTNIGVFSGSTGNRLTQLEITNGEIKTNIVNNLTFAGIKYNADFSANYTNRSLVDKGYVDGQLSSYLTTANAALTYQPLDSDLTSWAGVTRASGFDTFATTPSSANLSSLLTDKTGTGVNVFGTSPTFTTDITTPLIIGGSAVGSNITYKSTSGTGTTTAAAHTFTGGTNGGTTIATLYNNGNFSIGNYASPNNLRLVTIGQDSAWLSIGSRSDGAAEGCIYINATTPTTGNFALSGISGETRLNGTSRVDLRINNINQIRITGSEQIFSPSGASSGAATSFNFTTPANTGQTASTEISNFKVNGATKTWAAGAITTQRWNYFTANTAAFASASTITNSYGLYVEAATAGTNATITNNWALGTNGGIFLNGTANTVLGNAALATNATTGFLHVPSCAGVPTGVPTLYTGMIPICADSTNNKLYIYSGGAWVALN